MTAVAALLWQAACAIGFSSIAHLEVAAPAGSGCHESEPATPSMPGPGHVCCGGEHSPDALLRVADVTAIAMVSRMRPISSFDSAPAGRLFAATVSHPYGPPGPFALRI